MSGTGASRGPAPRPGRAAPADEGPGGGGPGVAPPPAGAPGAEAPGAEGSAAGASGLGKAGIGKAGIGETGIGETGIGEAGIGETGIGETGIGETGIGETGIGEAGIGETGIGETGIGEAGIGAPIVLLGAPVDAGSGRPGCLMGPAALRTAGLVTELERLGRTVRDRGDAWPHPALPADAPAAPGARARNLAAVAAWTRLLGGEVHALLAEGAVPVVLGGDHSLSMGTVNGAARHCADAGRALFVLWLDAHADFNTPDTSPSGNMHGMPLAALCGEPGLEAVFAGAPRAVVPPGNVHLFGIRSVDRGERRLLRARGVDVVDMRVIDEQGVAAPLRRILERVRAGGGFLHVSLDVDFLDPALAPGVGTTVPGGATFREAHLVMEMLHDSGLVGSLDVVELNPFLDERGRSATLLVDLVSSLFGRQVMDRPTAAGA